MALQWVMLGYVVVAEALVALLLTFPWPRMLKARLVGTVSSILQPAMGIVPFATFQLLDVYWKNEHRLMCTSEACTSVERDRYERSIYKAQRNAVLSVSACLLYWIIFRICKYYNEIQNLEEQIKRLKET